MRTHETGLPENSSPLIVVTHQPCHIDVVKPAMYPKKGERIAMYILGLYRS